MRKLVPLFLVLLGYLFVAALYAINVPPWQAPDEPAHYNYIRQLAGGTLPIIAAGDYDQAYLDEIRGAQFAPQYPIEPIEYEDWQPPLYYLLLAPVYKLSSGSLPALRLVSILFGAGIMVLAYGITRLLFPKQAWLALTTAVLVAFIPQHLSIMASLNNDSLAELLIAAVLYVLVWWTVRDMAKGSRQETAVLLLLGLLLGLGFLTKGTNYLTAPLIGLVLLWQYWPNWRSLIRAGLLVFAPAFLLGALWWGRNLVVYGGLDFLGKSAHDSVVVGQPRTAEWIARFGLAGTVEQFARTTFNSFWGQFGWMAVPMPPRVYLLLLLLLGAAVTGLIVWAVYGRKQTEGRYGRIHLLLFLLLLLMTASLHIGYNFTFVQRQGRYLYPALIPIALGMAVGLGMWLMLLIRPFTTRLPQLPYLLPLTLGLGLAALNIFALYRWIIPLLTYTP